MPCLRHIASHRIALSRDIPLQGTSSLYSLIMSENIWPEDGCGGTWLEGMAGKDRTGSIQCEV